MEGFRRHIFKEFHNTHNTIMLERYEKTKTTAKGGLVLRLV
jgi:hypothetical protein